MDGVTINWIAVIAATVAGFMIGGLWYSPLLFEKPWMRAAGITEEQVKSANMPKIFGTAFAFQFVMAYCLAMFLAAPDIDLMRGALYGFFTGFGWLFFGIGTNAMFEQRSWSYIFINGGFWTVNMTAMGAILGAWA